MKTTKIFFQYLLDAAISSEVLPTSFNFQPLKVHNLSLLLKYPTKLYNEKIPAIIELVSSSKYSFRSWYNLIMSLRAPAVFSPEYLQILLALFNQIEQYGKVMKPLDFIKIAHKAHKLRIRSVRFWNKFYTEIMTHWSDFSIADKISLMSIVCQK